MGFATAQELVSEGAKVVLAARDQTALEEAVSALGGSKSALGVQIDLKDPTSSSVLVKAAIDAYGRIDGALLSVGGPPGGGILEVSDEQWLAAFESTFLGPLRTARGVAKEMVGPGAIAFVLSSSVRAPIPKLGISNGIRPGLAMAAKTMADELGPRNIRVFGLLPGRIDTDRTRQLDSSDANRRPAAEATIPLRRYGEPAEFGKVAAFLLSPVASYVTGSMIAVDGGSIRSI